MGPKMQKPKYCLVHLKKHHWKTVRFFIKFIFFGQSADITVSNDSKLPSYLLS